MAHNVLKSSSGIICHLDAEGESHENERQSPESSDDAGDGGRSCCWMQRWWWCKAPIQCGIEKKYQIKTSRRNCGANLLNRQHHVGKIAGQPETDQPTIQKSPSAGLATRDPHQLYCLQLALWALEHGKVDLPPGDGDRSNVKTLADETLDCIGKLHQVERLAREQQMTAEQIHALRQLAQANGLH